MMQVERFAAMGTRCELHLFDAAGADALCVARDTIEAVDDALTIHRPSAATLMNQRLLAGRSAPIDDPVLFDALVAVDDVHTETLGLFDVAADVRTGGSWAAITFDRQAARISAKQPLALDFGGFGKGFALDRAGAVLRTAGVASALLTFGESSIAVIGEHPLGGRWPFAIPHPDLPDQELATVELLDEALSISATVGAGTLAPDRAAMVRPGSGAVTAPRCTVAIESSGARAEAMSTALLVADAILRQRLAAGAQQRRLVFDFAEAAPIRMCA